MEIAAGTTLYDHCKLCKAKVLGIVNKSGVANFECSCGLKWHYSVVIRRATGGKFTSEWLKKYLKK